MKPATKYESKPLKTVRRCLQMSFAGMSVFRIKNSRIANYKHRPSTHHAITGYLWRQENIQYRKAANSGDTKYMVACSRI